MKEVKSERELEDSAKSSNQSSFPCQPLESTRLIQIVSCSIATCSEEQYILDDGRFVQEATNLGVKV